MHRIFQAFLSATVIALAVSATPVRASQDLLIGGGSVTGVYYQVALHVCNLINKHSDGKYNCVGRPALGSVFNINAVNRGLLDFGVAQSDRNFQAYKGTADWEGNPVTGLRSVFSMHPETVLVVTRKDSGIKMVSDLKGKRVNIGNPGSGQRGNAEDVLKIYGIDKDKDMQSEGLQQHDASRALVDRKIDAFFYTVGNPSAAIEEPANSTDITLVPVNSKGIKEFISDKPFYVMTAIKPGTYKGVDKPVETFAVKATVVASAEASEQMIYDVTKIIFENIDELRASHAAFKNLEPQEMLGGLSAPLHPGAAKYYKERGWKLPSTL
ncbi:MAG: C4-dicarboxylate ABC transporter substrate-binding protein [Proteobacteria bacterium]|nr:MAG: C4-dicarboxylate ABC transporter substrate-binding protein [Pseudomonadota bacterium]QKK11809.1 MAG: TAXI family TRAP transporter solute-binding subunit [Pseudomonadota bacterium]